MRVRPNDANGDMMPVQDRSQMLEGAAAVAQIAKERLLFFHGDWWEDEELGIRIPEFLASSVRKSDVSMFAKLITSYIGNTEGVTGVANARAEFKNREMIYSATLLTSEGAAELEVNLNGLLSAQY